jgi:hypothetical protein
MDQLHVDSLRYAPLLNGMMLPMCLLFNVQALLVPGWLWKAPRTTTKPTLPDNDEEDPGAIVFYHPLYLKIILGFSLVFGIVACIALFLRCSMLVETERRRRATWLMIWTGFLQSFLLFILITIFLIQVLPLPYGVYFTQGFFYALASGIFSIVASALRAYDVITRKRGKETRWGLSDQQTQLILLVISFVSYLTIGSVVFSVIEQWSFDDAVYWSVVTFATIGFGDFVPKTDLGMGLTPLYAAGGIVCMGGLIYGIREVVLEYVTFTLAATFSTELQGGDRFVKRDFSWFQSVTERAMRKMTWSSSEETQPFLRGSSGYAATRHGSVLSLEAEPGLFRRAASTVSVTAPYRGPGGRTKRRTFSISNRPILQERSMVQEGVHEVPRRQSPLQEAYPIDIPQNNSTDDTSLSKSAPASPMTNRVSGNTFEPVATVVPSRADRRVITFAEPEVRRGFSDTEELRTIRLKRSKSLPEINVETTFKKQDVVDVTTRALNNQILLGIGLLGLHLSIFGYIFARMESWTALEGIFFCATSISTIGYGNLVPTTTRARNVFLIYVFLGIPNVTFIGSVVAERLSNQWRVHVDKTGVLTLDDEFQPQESDASAH